MKALAIVLMCTVLALGLVAGAGAQTAPPEARPEQAPQSPAPQTDTKVTVPGSSERPDVNVDIRSGRDDGGAALPRQSTRETTGIFGLSPTTVALLAAALFIVVVLAVVAMTRGGSETRVDLDRRL